MISPGLTQVRNVCRVLAKTDLVKDLRSSLREKSSPDRSVLSVAIDSARGLNAKGDIAMASWVIAAAVEEYEAFPACGCESELYALEAEISKEFRAMASDLDLRQCA